MDDPDSTIRDRAAVTVLQRTAPRTHAAMSLE
jgi:hypothetical protein